MESPPLARYIPQKSKKRVFPGGTSSCMEPEVIEISPPINRSSKSKSMKQKEVIRHEIIDVDMDEDCGDVMLIEGKVDTNNKGKEAMAIISLGPSSAANLGSVDGVQSSKKSCTPGSHNLINLDGLSSDLSYGDDDYMDMYYEDLMYDDDYAILQSHFDNIDIPPGVEAPIPWLPGPAQNKNRSATARSSGQSVLQIQPNAVGYPPAVDASNSLWSAEPGQMKKKSISKSSSTVKTPFHAASHPHKAELSPTWSFAETARSKKKVVALTSSSYAGSQTQRGALDVASSVQRRKLLRQSFHNYSKPAVSGGTSYYSPNELLGALKLIPGIEPSAGGSYFPNSTMQQVGSVSLFASSHMPIETINPAPGVDASVPKWLNPPMILNNQSHMFTPDYPGFIDSFHGGPIFPEEVAYLPYVQDSSKIQKSAIDVGDSTVPSGSSSGIGKDANEDDILEKFQLFKKFDTVQDDSDHHYLRNGSSLKQPSKNWAKKIQEEWKILEKDLPDTIFVRVYESRMDLLRAVIVGAEGTPYHDGLFFFDVFFPSSYPNVPPHVYYHSGGLRINPNLYNCGKVCLSLLNTWSGSQKEKWIPGVSTMLQVLVSIQGLILNTKPFFNEPGYANMSGSANGEKSSLQYNENTFILSLKTMVYAMKRAPKHFEDFVVGHFCKRARDILVACKAYMDGAQVGCLVRGGVQDVDEGDKSCSQGFKDNLGRYINTLVNAFAQVGVKDCEKIISPAQMGNRQVSPVPKPVIPRLISPVPKAESYYYS